MDNSHIYYALSNPPSEQSEKIMLFNITRHRTVAGSKAFFRAIIPLKQ